MSESLRVFIGIELSLGVCEKLSIVQEDLRPLVKERGGKVKWVEVDNIHLTLKFLGERHYENLLHVRDLMRGVAAKVKPFWLELEGLGGFPEDKEPRVLFAKVKEGEAALAKLVEGLDEALEGAGIQRDSRPFHPHVTLGRVNQEKYPLSLEDVIEALGSVPLGRTEVLECILYESVLGSNGPQYRVVERAQLKGVQLAGVSS